jgi:hypothetical protein
MQSTTVYESIDVIAAFSKGKVKPLVFSYRGERYQEFQITRTWDKFDGDDKLLCYSLKLGRCNYEISFNSRDLNWHLIKVICFP